MGNFITKSVTYDGKQNHDVFIAPMFIGKNPLETQGIKIMPNIQSGEYLNLFSKIQLPAKINCDTLVRYGDNGKLTINNINPK